MAALGCRPNIRLFSNPVGQAWTGVVKSYAKGVCELINARKQPFGLLKGSSDICGWKSVIVTPEMVGHKIAIFVGIEIKTIDDKLEPEQQKWLRWLVEAGAICGVARSVPEAERIVDVEINTAYRLRKSSPSLYD